MTGSPAATLPAHYVAGMPEAYDPVGGATVEFAGSSLSYLYPALLDVDSDDRSFTTTGMTAYVYYTRNHAGHASLDRDLVRVPVEFVLDRVRSSRSRLGGGLLQGELERPGVDALSASSATAP